MSKAMQGLLSAKIELDRAAASGATGSLLLSQEVHALIAKLEKLENFCEQLQEAGIEVR